MMAATDTGSVPLCENAIQARLLDGRQVRLIGTYLPLPTLKQMPRPGRAAEEVELGQVVIQIEGSASEYDRTAARDTPARIELGSSFRAPEEIAALRHRRVSVEGRLVLAPPVQDPNAAAPKPAPVLLEPAGLRLAEPTGA
jgi:hypothetical protein